MITGGNYDVDMELVGPNGQILYKDSKKQYDSFTWTADQKGEYRFCFSNEFSTFTHKIVYFDLQVGDDDDALGPDVGDHATAMTQVLNVTPDISVMWGYSFQALPTLHVVARFKQYK